MKRRDLGQVLLATAVMMLFSTTTALAAGAGKIGIVDAVGALQQSQWGKAAAEELKKIAEKMDGDLEQKQKAFTGAKEEFDKKQGVLDAKAKTQKGAGASRHAAGGAKVPHGIQGQAERPAGVPWPKRSMMWSRRSARTKNTI